MSLNSRDPFFEKKSNIYLCIQRSIYLFKHLFDTIVIIFQATVQVRNGEVILSGDFVDEDIVPLKFQSDAEATEKYDEIVPIPETQGIIYIFFNYHFFD